MARRNKAKAQTQVETQSFSTYVQKVCYCKDITYISHNLLSYYFFAIMSLLYKLHLKMTVYICFRSAAQVSSPPRRTLYDFLSCLRTSWRWSTWSAHSWWLCANCWSCSPSARTTCCVFSWWCNWEPSSRTTRWGTRTLWFLACMTSAVYQIKFCLFWCLCNSFLLPFWFLPRWLQQRAWQLWVCQNYRQRVVVVGWGLWVSPLTSYVSRCSKWATECLSSLTEK